MKISPPVLIIIVAALLLPVTACRQTATGKSKSHWYLQSPGTAAGYDRPPVDIGTPKDNSADSPAAPDTQGKTAPAVNEATSQQQDTESSGTNSPKPSWKIEPPPSAAGYGRPPVDIGTPKDNSADSPAAPDTQGKTAPAVNEATSQQQDTESSGTNSPKPSWKIEPPPSAAGYGRPPVDIGTPKDNSADSPAAPDTQGKTAPAVNEATSQQQDTESSGPASITPSWKIVPPPSAAGYGK